ncbi:MAG: hypothetical protein IPP08_00550 [Chlorobiota bacterium]|jgi:hypothetical protein|nr:hypothetical protein [Chlorobiota bacterium]QQS66701.1 MAG: hypothetical protein IPP08_00550 [Chlorobiota bacterium]
MKIFKHKLDIYYISGIAYGTIFLLYIIISGGVIGEMFEVVWRDPIVYLLGILWIVSIIALIAMGIAKRKIIIDNKVIIFHSNLKERIFNHENILWISIARESKVRLKEIALPVMKFKLKNRRRALWLRPAGFENSAELVKEIKEWAKGNDIVIKSKKRK